jgi:DegV family protein with EDD domain
MTSLTLRNTAIVVDSTCDPPPGFFEQEGIFLVPLTVHFGDETYRDQVDLTHDEFFAKLEASAVLPTTSQPTIAEFQRCYAEATATYEHVLSLHLSRKLSGTMQAAEAAATDLAAVEVIDTHTVCTAIALLVERLRTRLRDGIDHAEARAYIDRYCANSHTLIHADTLEYLRRGGRIGAAASVVGGLLGIHPVIQVANGEVAPYAKARGFHKARAAMLEYLDSHSTAQDQLYVGLVDAKADPAVLVSLSEQIVDLRPNAQILMTGQVGAVVGTHIGPGTHAYCMIVE